MTNHDGILFPLTVRISGQMLKLLDIQAKRRRVTKSELVRQAIEQMLASEECAEDAA